MSLDEKAGSRSGEIGAVRKKTKPCVVLHCIVLHCVVLSRVLRSFFIIIIIIAFIRREAKKVLKLQKQVVQAVKRIVLKLRTMMHRE